MYASQLTLRVKYDCSSGLSLHLIGVADESHRQVTKTFSVYITKLFLSSWNSQEYNNAYVFFLHLS